MTSRAASVPSDPQPVRQPDIGSRERMWQGFLTVSAWLGLHVLLTVAYLTVVFTIGMNWLTALIILFAAGLAAGWLMKLSRAWILAMLIQAGIVLVARLFILLFRAVL